MRSTAIIRIGITLTALALAGCNTEAPGGVTDPVASSTATRAPRYVDKSDRPQVTFDPCLDLPDATLVEAGYDPKSEETADFTPDSYTFLGCSYDTPQRLYGLNVLSGNISFAEEQEKKKAYAEAIEINGRRALLDWQPDVRDDCAVSMKTAYGILIVSRIILKDSAGPSPESEWCAGLEDTARIFEPFLPKGE